jgi:oxalate decarboxylase/phosphoglucose isomerase-like protein (cupin superfamily)
MQIKPGAARAPHWHDTWEQQILISGKAKTSLIDKEGRVHDVVLTQGMVAVLPAGMTHWIETIGDQPAVLLLSFPAGFKTFELDDSLIQVGRKDQRCVSDKSASCGAKQKSLILIVKDGLI